jgi:hypothetical protein
MLANFEEPPDHALATPPLLTQIAAALSSRLSRYISQAPFSTATTLTVQGPQVVDREHERLSIELGSVCHPTETETALALVSWRPFATATGESETPSSISASNLGTSSGRESL